MKTVDYSYTGGFPFEQRTANDMQLGYLDILQAVLGFLKVPATGSHVVYGCKIVGPDITPGMMYINGDLCSFAGSVGTSATKIKKVIVTETAPFANGSNNPVYKDATAVVDLTGVALSTFTRLSEELVYDAFYQHTDNNFSDAYKAKLDAIETAAEVNVQADWNVVSPLSDAYILNKPNIPNVLRHSSFVLGDFPSLTDEIRTITFPDIGTIDYSVFASLVSNGGWNIDNDVIFTIKNKTSTSFDLCGREVSPNSQDLTLDYILIEKP